MADPLSSPSKGGVRIRAITGRSILRLKSWLPKNDAAVTVAGIELPARIGALNPGELRALCTGPSDWLLVSRSRLLGSVRGRIGTEAASQGLAVADLSAGLAVLEISGAAVQAVLAKSCGLDFDPRNFSYPQCARTRLAQLAVVIDIHDSEDGVDLYVARSYDSWLNDWLTDSNL